MGGNDAATTAATASLSIDCDNFFIGPAGVQFSPPFRRAVASVPSNKLCCTVLCKPLPLSAQLTGACNSCPFYCGNSSTDFLNAFPHPYFLIFNSCPPLIHPAEAPAAAPRLYPATATPATGPGATAYGHYSSRFTLPPLFSGRNLRA